MDKRLRNGMASILILGTLIFIVSRVFRQHFSDFALGFFDGASTVCIVVWGIYSMYYLINKKNPNKA